MPKPTQPSNLSKLNIRGIKQIAEIKAKEYSIFPIMEKGVISGYRSREDLTMLAPNTLVSPSQNVLTNVYGRIYSRPGYTLYGQSNSNGLPILSSYDWETHLGTIRNLRVQSPTSLTNNDGQLQVGYVANAGDKYNGTTLTQGQVEWIPILSNLSSAYCNFSPFWDSTQFIQRLLMVNGGQGIYDWSGAVATVSSVSDSSSAIMSIATSPIAAGSGYVAGDVLTISGGTGGQVTVNSIVNGSITALSLIGGGNCYNISDIISVASGPSNDCRVLVTGASGGVITSFSITNGGSGYTAGNLAQGGYGSDSPGSASQLAIFSITTVVNGAIGAPYYNNSVPPLTLTNPGSGYSTGTQNTTGGTGSGATVNVISLATNAITIAGSKSIGALGFYNDLNVHKIIINGTTFSYTASPANANSQSFLSVTPDPTTNGSIVPGDVIIQVPEFTANTGTNNNGLPLINTATFTNWTNDLILCLTLGGNQYTMVGCLKNNNVYVSNGGTFTTYTIASNSVTVGNGILLNLDAPPVSFIINENGALIDAGKDWKYILTLSGNVSTSTTTATQNWALQPLKTSLLQATQSQGLIAKAGDYIVFVSNETLIRSMGRVTDVLATPQMPDISYPIINDIINYNFTDGHVKFNKNFVYITLPKQNKMIIYNMTNNEDKEPGSKGHYWEAPQIFPIGCLSVINGNIIGHSYLTSESYTLFNGSSDNGNSIQSIAAFPQNTYGMRHKTKSFNRVYAEGYLSQQTQLTLTNYYYGSNKTTTLSKIISGMDGAINNNPPDTSSLGKSPLGKNPIGGDLIQNTGIVQAPNFHVYKSFTRVPFFTHQPVFSSVGLGQSWQLLAYGVNEQSTSELETSITE